MVPVNTYQISHPTRQDSLDNHTSAAPSNDAKPQTCAIVDQVDHFQLGPVRT